MSEERIITAATVTSGEKGDGPQLPQLVDESRNNGMEVECVIGDSAYSGDANLKKAADEDFKIVAKLNPCVSQGFRKEGDKFDFNKDAGMYICPAGHLAIRKAKQGKIIDRKNQAIVYHFDVEKCKFCSKKEGCYKEGAKHKTYSVPLKTNEQTAQMKFQESLQFKDKSKHRYKIEAKNAELKHAYGYDRAQSYGLECMQMQGALAIFTVNIKRILKLM